MRTRNSIRLAFPATLPRATAPRHLAVALWFWLGLSLTVLNGCKRDRGLEAMESDANGYVCLKCGVKLYTERSVFIGPRCPKCGEDTLSEVVGYYCEKDKHLNIRARRGESRGAVCDQCQSVLVNAMRSPREHDLRAWGATKTSG